MAFLPQWLNLQPPRTFLWAMSLRTGTEMIALSMLINKITGFYGMLAILTGLKLNAAQLSMYIYSVFALILIGILIPHIRRQTPLQCLALAWFYLIDTIVNSMYSIAFAVTWFLTVSASKSTGDVPSSAPGAGMINDTAGFTSPEYNVSEVDVIATPAAGILSGQDAIAIASAGGAAVAAGDPSLQHGVQVAESIPSIMLIAFFMLIRVYFILVVVSYARQVLHQHVQATSRQHLHMDGADDVETNPFVQHRPEGQGWRGKLGRIMVSLGRGFWLGGMEDDAWTRDANNRFKAAKPSVILTGRDTFERERRARSGTGPPQPSTDVLTGTLPK